MSGGKATVAGTGKTYRLVFGGTWAVGDKFTLILTNTTTQVSVQIGAGRVTGAQPTFCFTFKRKIYVLAGQFVYFCEIDTPTKWNDLGLLGAGSISMVDTFGSPENLMAIAPYQGRLAFFSDKNIQIWKVEADPASNELQQVLPGIGTVAKLSVHSLGELDVLFLSRSGVRSLRVRDSSLNAYVSDLGSPIDMTLHNVLASTAITEAQKSGACGVVDSVQGRYWLFLVDTIYVLSYYPTSKIVAWGSYEARDFDDALFVPSRFLTVNKIVTVNEGLSVVARSPAGLQQHSHNFVQPYRITDICTVEGYWIDTKKPATMKQFTAVDIVLTGKWKIYVTTDQLSQEYTEILDTNVSPFQGGRIALSMMGTHLRWKAVTNQTDPTMAEHALISSFIIHYDELDAS